jgi:poly-gamma-glutamate synthesis protein (capsule biosynthesis protein)
MIDEKKNMDGKATLLLTGDVMLGGEFLKYKQKMNLGFEYPFKNLKNIFEDADIIFGNLENPLSKDGVIRADKSSILFAPPDSINALRYLRYDIVSLSNNHINDYGEGGMKKTIEILDNEGIRFFGAGRNIEEASKEKYIEKNGVKICFLGYTTDEIFVRSIIAGPGKAGCVLYNYEHIKKDIDRVRNHSDIICISLHWGHEYYRYPSPDQVELAHKIIDAGAHMVIGHHPHVVQGYEKYKHGVIFYSLGNFFFPDFNDKSGYLHHWSEESNISIIAKCDVIHGNIDKIEVFHSYMDVNFRVTLLKGNKMERAISQLDEISRDIMRIDYERFWRNYNKKRSKELKEMEIETRFPRLLQRINELGIKGCIKKVSIRNIKEVGTLLGGYLKNRIKRSPRNPKMTRRDL